MASKYMYVKFQNLGPIFFYCPPTTHEDDHFTKNADEK